MQWTTQPPVIHLYDLHVRLNASVKSLVQLLLLEKGEHPEMFRLEFLTKREAKEWEAALNTAIEECKKRVLKCECFGCEKILSGDEERKSEEKEVEDSDREGEQAPATKSGPDTSPSILRRFRATESLEFATRLLSTAPSLTTTDVSTTNRHTGAAFAAVVSLRSRNHTWMNLTSMQWRSDVIIDPISIADRGAYACKIQERTLTADDVLS